MKWAAIDEIRRVQTLPAPINTIVAPATPPAETDEDTENARMDTDVVVPANGVRPRARTPRRGALDARDVEAQRLLARLLVRGVRGVERARLLNKLADLMEESQDILSALEALDNGKTFNWAKRGDVSHSITCIRYYAGWADKNYGKTIEVRPPSRDTPALPQLTRPPRRARRSSRTHATSPSASAA